LFILGYFTFFLFSKNIIFLLHLHAFFGRKHDEKNYIFCCYYGSIAIVDGMQTPGKISLTTGIEPASHGENYCFFVPELYQIVFLTVT